MHVVSACGLLRMGYTLRPCVSGCHVGGNALRRLNTVPLLQRLNALEATQLAASSLQTRCVAARTPAVLVCQVGPACFSRNVCVSRPDDWRPSAQFNLPPSTH